MPSQRPHQSTHLTHPQRAPGASRLGIFAGLLCLALSALPVAAATAAQDDERAQSAAQEQAVRISRRQASELVRERYEGRILNIRLERGTWRLRLDNDGVVFNVLVDAQTGEITLPEE